jgi:hypothetical protein
VGIAGQSIKQNLSTMNPGGKVMTFELKNVNGKWLISKDTNMNLVPKMPGAPTTPSNPI